MTSRAGLGLRKLALPFLVLVLAACAEEPPPMVARYPAPPPPRPTARPAGHNLARNTPHAMAPIGPSGPAGPLLVARVGSYMDSLESDLRRHVRGKGIIVARLGDEIAVIVRDDRLFAPSGTLAGDDVLEPLGAVLDGYVHTTIAVNGYTDTAGEPQQNLAFSQKRAQMVADALTHEGVAPQRVTAQGFGETHLRIATGDDKKEPRNRRIEIMLKASPERTTATR